MVPVGPLRERSDERGRGMNTLRLEAFSDGVLAFAFTLLVLDSGRPTAPRPFAYLLSLWRNCLDFASASC